MTEHATQSYRAHVAFGSIIILYGKSLYVRLCAKGTNELLSLFRVMGKNTTDDAGKDWVEETALLKVKTSTRTREMRFLHLNLTRSSFYLRFNKLVGLPGILAV